MEATERRRYRHGLAGEITRGGVAWAAIVLGLLLAPGTAGAAGDGPSWEEAAGLQAIHGDSLDPGARIFDSPDYQYQLLVPGDGDTAFLLELKGQAVKVLPQASLQWDEDGLPMPDVESASDPEPFFSDDGVVSFGVGEDEWKIQPEPPLVGEVSLDGLKKAKPDYFLAAAKYKPDAKAVAALHAVSEETRVVVFFGTWCSYCKKWLPRFLKTLEEADNPKIKPEFIGVSEDQLEPAELLRRYSVSETPVFIVLRGGKELGRIVENPDVSIEADLVSYLGAR